MQAEANKKAKYSSSNDGILLGPTEQTPQELEASLTLPVDTDETRIAQTALELNRAPLVLAFAVELIRHTMPEQPPSSRLSLAQAAVSANSRSKAVSIGLEKGASADEEGFGEGQPRVKVMGREICVLKRGGYEWKGEEEENNNNDNDQNDEGADHAATSSEPAAKTENDAKSTTSAFSLMMGSSFPNTNSVWSTSSSVSLKKSTFVARATTITDPTQCLKLTQSLLDTNPSLRTASHNVWAYRIRPSTSSSSTTVRESSSDDGETGGGDLLLRVMRESNVVDTLVIMTRWYGGVMLGPDRWRLMRNVVQGALAERLRITGVKARLGGEAVWGLNLEAMRAKTTNPSSYNNNSNSNNIPANAIVGGFVIHRPEAARNYLLRSISSVSNTSIPDHQPVPSSPNKKKSDKAQNVEKEENLGLLLGALRLLFDSWTDRLTADELDRRAWGWYTAVRPAVESGPSGWGAKGVLRLRDILDLRRKAA